MRLESRGESDEAIAVFRDLKRLRPGNARHLGCLGDALEDKGLSREAERDARSRRGRGPRGDPAQARRRRGPPQPRQSP